MRENTKRLLTLVLAVSMVLSMMPISVSAQEQTEETPKQETTQTLPEIETEVVSPLDAVFSPETARPLTLGMWDDVRMSDIDQTAYFSFTPAEDGIYAFGADLNGSINVQILDAAGNVLKTGYCGNFLGEETLVYGTFTAGQTYYYAISYAEAWDGPGTIAVLLTQSTLVDLQFEPINLIENTEGNEEEYGYYYEPNFFLANYRCTATFRDGTTLTSNGDGFTYNGQYYGIWGYPNQSEENPWTVGNTYTMDVSCMGITFQVPVSIVPSPVVSLDIRPITVVENTRGTESTYWDQETQTEISFYQYVEWQLMHETSFTATLSDGTVINSTTHFFEYNGETCYLSLESSQYEKPWTVGNTYTMKATMLGTTVEVPVTIMANPLVSLTVTPVSTIEKTCGGINHGWNPETEQYDLPYYFYSVHDLLSRSTYTATFKDGTVLTGSANADSLEYMGKRYDFNIGSDQSYDNQWTAGNRYTIQLTLLGITADIPVDILPTPVVSLDIAPINVTMNTCGREESFWDEETQTSVKYFHYAEWQLMASTNFTATFSDGSVISGTEHFFDYNGETCYFEYETKQGQQEQWTVGNTYTMKVTMLGKTVEVPVTISDIPLVSLSFEPISVQENTCGGTSSYWNPETQRWEEYFEYSIYQMLERTAFYAVFNDGTTLSGSGDGFYYNDLWYSFEYSNPQNNENQWTVNNTYNIPITVMGKQANFSVAITPSPLVSLEFTPVTFMEGTNGDITSNYDPENTQYYYRYYLWNALSMSTYTATFTDGTVLTGSGGSLFYNGEEYYFNEALVSQTYESQWLPGNSYYFAVGCMGKTFQLPVTIERSPLVSLTINPANIIEGSCGSWAHYDTGMEQGTYFRYNEWDVLGQTTYTVVFADGTTYTQSASTGFYYDGQWYSPNYRSKQDFQNQWTLGNTYYMQFTILGKTVEVPVSIVPTPVVSVEYQPILLKEHQDGEWYYGWDEYGNSQSYFKYDWRSKLSLTITLNDGSVITSGGYGFNYNGKWQNISISDSQSLQTPWLTGNTYTETLNVLGYETQVAISVCTSESADGYDYIVQGGKAIITDCYLTDEVLNIPDTINGNSVVGITYLGFALDHALEISIPDSVTMLSSGVFEIWGYYEDVNVPLQKLHLGAGISNIDPYMLTWMRNLEQITVSADNQSFCSVDGVLYDKNCTNMVIYPFGKTSHHVIPDSVENIDVIFELADMYKDISYQLGKGVKDYTEVDGVIYTKDMTEVVTCTSRATGNYVMPESVTSIRKLAFANSKLTSVTVSPNVTRIVYAGFYGSDKLESIILPENLEAIEMLAFDSCTSLKSIEIPASVTYIGSAAFYDCYSLSAVYADSLDAWCSITFDGSNANPLKFAEKLYVDGQLLTDLVIPGATEFVYDYAFYNANLNSITVPSFVYDIGYSAFYGTTAQTLKLSEGLWTIQPTAFAYSNIESVVIPDTVFYMGYEAFYCCKNLESVTLSQRLTEIPSDCFAYTGLTSVVLPENIEYVGSCAFQNSKLKEVTFDCKNVYIGDNAFENCPLGDLDLKENIEGIDFEAFCGTMATKVNIPNTVTGLTYREFAFSYNLVSVTLPDTLEYIGTESFRGDSILSHVLFTGTEEQWNAIDIGSQEILDATVHFNATGNEVTTLQTCTQVVLHCSICEEWVTVNKIKANHTMVDGTCTACGHVGDWEYRIQEETNTVIITGYSGTDGEPVIPETIQGKPVTAIAPGAFKNVGGIYAITLPDNLLEIGYGAFENAPHLYEVNFGDGLKVIGDFAFKGCERLNEINLPEGLEMIGNGAFDSCYWIQSIYIPETVKIIGDYAFDGCYHLEKIELPKGLTRIGNYAFYGTLIQSIDIPETVTEIGYGAFQWCERLEEVTIPASVTKIGYDAFSENFFLNCIVFMGDAPEIAPIAFSGVCAKALYDADNDTWTEDVLRGYNGELYWNGCHAPRITKQMKDVYADESGWASVTFESRDYNANVYWYGAMPGEEFEMISKGYGSFDLQLDEKNSGYRVYAELIDPLGRSVTTRVATMKLAPTMTGIQITKMPNKVEYDLNQGLRTTGMVVMGNYSDGTKMEITNYQITGYRADQSGEQTITVSYGNFTATYTVTVKEEVQNFTSTEQKVEISAPVGAIEAGAELVVEEVFVAEELPEIPPVILDNEYIVYDISFEKEGETVQPTQDVEVSIPVPEYMAGMGCKIFYVDNENNAIDMDARYEDGYMVFTVPHFSYYAIVQMPGVHITGELTGAETAVVNLKQNGEIVHTTEAEDGIYNFECVASGEYTLEVIAEGQDTYTTEITVGEKDLAVDVMLLMPGDFTGDGFVTNDDVIHLLWHTLFPETYPIAGKADFTGDGEITNEDVIHLLWHTLFPEDYPLN